MATREENLKKINEELEKLDDEQLEKIAGGALGRRYEINLNIDKNLLNNVALCPTRE